MDSTTQIEDVDFQHTGPTITSAHGMESSAGPRSSAMHAWPSAECTGLEIEEPVPRDHPHPQGSQTATTNPDLGPGDKACAIPSMYSKAEAQANLTTILERTEKKTKTKTPPALPAKEFDSISSVSSTGTLISSQSRKSICCRFRWLILASCIVILLVSILAVLVVHLLTTAHPTTPNNGETHYFGSSMLNVTDQGGNASYALLHFQYLLVGTMGTSTAVSISDSANYRAPQVVTTLASIQVSQSWLSSLGISLAGDPYVQGFVTIEDSSDNNLVLVASYYAGCLRRTDSGAAYAFKQSHVAQALAAGLSVNGNDATIICLSAPPEDNGLYTSADGEEYIVMQSIYLLFTGSSSASEQQAHQAANFSHTSTIQQQVVAQPTNATTNTSSTEGDGLNNGGTATNSSSMPPLPAVEFSLGNLSQSGNSSGNSSSNSSISNGSRRRRSLIDDALSYVDQYISLAINRVFCEGDPEQSCRFTTPELVPRQSFDRWWFGSVEYGVRGACFKSGDITFFNTGTVSKTAFSTYGVAEGEFGLRQSSDKPLSVSTEAYAKHEKCVGLVFWVWCYYRRVANAATFVDISALTLKWRAELRITSLNRVTLQITQLSADTKCKDARLLVTQSTSGFDISTLIPIIGPLYAFTNTILSFGISIVQLAAFFNLCPVIKSAIDNAANSAITNAIRDPRLTIDNNAIAIGLLVAGAQLSYTQSATCSPRGMSICFSEVEGSSRCMGNRGSCSGLSALPYGTRTFGDGTDDGSGGCQYRWQIQQTRPFTNVEYRLCFNEQTGASQCQGSRNTCTTWGDYGSWTQPFRDATQSRYSRSCFLWWCRTRAVAGDVCEYRWRIEERFRANTPTMKCRVHFRETEGSERCTGSRASVSGWSNQPSPTEGFRDDTDSKGSCQYAWRLECVPQDDVVPV